MIQEVFIFRLNLGHIYDLRLSYEALSPGTIHNVNVELHMTCMIECLSFRIELNIQCTMATPQDKFDNTKPLAVEEMNKTSFARWMAEAHNEAS